MLQRRFEESEREGERDGERKKGVQKAREMRKRETVIYVERERRNKEIERKGKASE